MKLGVAKETHPGERRVALVPALVGGLRARHIEVQVERGAGVAAGYRDEAYVHAGAQVVERQAVLQGSDMLAVVRCPSSDADLAMLTPRQGLVGFLDPLGNPQRMLALARTGVTSFAMELVPRITRAQAMDALSSMASLAGYKGVVLAAAHSPRIFPMMITAAGTLTPARVVVLGAGVAGLSAIATAKRLGAVVLAYDIRPEAKEQVQSVGGKFIDLGLDAQDATDRGGYAKAQSAEFYRAQQERLAEHVRDADVLVTTAAVPGRRAPILVTAAMQKGMRPGSIVVDLASESGGNCELTRPGEDIDIDGVTIMGPLNLPASVPFHASHLYAKNIVNFVSHLTGKDGAFAFEPTDEISRDTLVTRGGEVVQPRVRDALSAPRIA